MDPALYNAVTQGDLTTLEDIWAANPEHLSRSTPQRNTALHIAARLGHQDIARRILEKRETLLLEKNIDGDTPLHIASKFGKIEVADLLINYSVGWPIDIESEEDQNRFAIKNKMGNTALHEAVTHGKSEVAMRLLNAEPLGYMLNDKKESPLQIAAREGLAMVVSQIFEQPWVETEEETKIPASPLHYAVLAGHIRLVEMLLCRRSDFVKKIDSDGNNALHCAARKNIGKIAKMLIEDSSIAYVGNNDGQTPLHMAVQYGSTSAIETILRYRPDTVEQLGFDGGNAFHIAVNKGKLNSLKCLMKHIQQGDLINHRDNEGNTPLHLAAKTSMTEMSILLARDKRVNPCVLNHKGDTPRSVIELLKETSDKDFLVWSELKKVEAKKCEKSIIPPPRDAIMQSKAEKYFKLNFQTYSIIAALITTVTFASTFTMPGGYDQQTGFAILRKEATFKIFVIFNTIAMCSALVVMVCFIWAPADMVKFKLIQRKLLHRLTILASVSLLVSLITAVYLVVESIWLVSLVILIGLSTPVMVCVVLGFEVLSS